MHDSMDLNLEVLNIQGGANAPHSPPQRKPCFVMLFCTTKSLIGHGNT